MTVQRYELLNHIAASNNSSSYLEIGVFDTTDCFDHVNVERKVGVDPNPKVVSDNTLLFHGESDAFFAVDRGLKFDLVFIDGLHLEEQVKRDVLNSLDVLLEGGVIVLHDCLPWDISVAGDTQTDPIAWLGTVWKAFAHFRMTRSDLEMFTVDIDCGCGIIRRGSQDLFPFTQDLTWEFFLENRTELMRRTILEDALRIL